MPQFMLMLREATWPPAGISAEEIQNIIGRYIAWSASIRATGHKLRDNEGRVVRRNGSGLGVTDGPFAEAREILGGLMFVEAKDYDDAVRLCEGSPHFDFGSIEIRQVENTGA